MAALDLSLPSIIADMASGNLSIQGVEMDEDDIDILDSPAEEASPLAPDRSSYDKQRANLAVYLDALPYKCESLQEMQQKLERIMAKLLICVESKNCWLQLRYPMATSTRVKLVRLYYELCLIPGLDVRVIRSWANMISRLLGKTGKRRIESKDLHLPWWPLWQLLYKELFPKKRLGQTNRNLNNILLYVAECCKPYFTADDIPDMLSTFLPMITPNTILTMIPVLTSFLPPSHPHLYLPVVFKLWEAFNSFSMDDRFLELAGNLAEEHVAGKAGNFGEEGGAQYQDVGIWSEQEWNLLVSKGFESMYVPVGKSRNPHLTSAHADAASVRQGSKIKKTISRITTPSSQSGQITYLAGSKAMDTLDRLITSTESFFHPSNHGHWTVLLTNFLQRLTAEFADRWSEEHLPSCRTPVTRRLTTAIRRAFVTSLLTPALLAMFSKDPLSLAMTQGALRVMAQLEPALVMPELLERAYGGLEVVNETHRTTAVLKILAGISLPLVSEKLWRPGQKHLLPLLELCIPGIDLNDPNKTICATSFIISAIQHVKIGDISMHQSGFALSGDTPSEDLMELDNDETQLPEGVEASPFVALNREEERTLVRESTSGFADWVVSLFRRILALYENLPEEGGRKKTTGGKTEEAVLKSIKSMADVVCLHLSDQLFNLVLNLVYDYATTNAKSNAVRAFGHLVACLARAKPQETINKFLPFCVLQIQEELKHGASSIRTTSTHESVPSDTTLHWNMAILRGCLGYGGPALLKHKETVIHLLSLLLEKTKSERGYSGTAALVSRVLHTLTTVYPINNHFVNSNQWADPDFNKAHAIQWGHLVEPRDAKIEWHVPNVEEVDFVLQILDHIASPTLDKLDALVNSSDRWDGVARNDFCRYLAFSKAVWSGMPTIYKEAPKKDVNSCVDPDVDVEGLIVDQLDVQAGIVLTDPQDPRYQRIVKLRTRFGNLIHLAAKKLRQDQDEEDHIDAVIVVIRALDTFFLDYGMSRGDFTTLQKNFTQSREVNRMSSRQKDNARVVWVKRAQLYHSSRLYMHALYRRRSELDDRLLKDDLAALCLSPYTRVRRLAQNVLHNVCGYYVRSTRYILPTMFDSLSKGNNPDRMKGALYVLGNKGTTAYIMADQRLQRQYLLRLLECQHEEKPSVQKLVSTNSSDCLIHLNEEAIRTAAYIADVPRVHAALLDLEAEVDARNIDNGLRGTVLEIAPKRVQKQVQEHEDMMKSVLDIAVRPTTHWRYVQMAVTFILGLMRRDEPTSPDVVRFLMEQTTSVQPLIRLNAQQGIVRESLFIKMRTYAKNDEELWLCQWRNPLSREIAISDHTQFLNTLHNPVVGPDNSFIDKLETGFLTWTTTIRGYTMPDSAQPTMWDASSAESLAIINEHTSKDYYSKLVALWSQETDNTTGVSDLRPENVLFIKSIAKMFGDAILQDLLDIVEPLLASTDKFQQAAAAEILTGLLRGSKHWHQHSLNGLWVWFVPRFDQILSQARPDTVVYWTSFLQTVLEDRDPRRNKPLVDWILSLQLDFQGDSAFAVTKSLNAVVVLMDAMGVRFNPISGKFVSLFFDNADSNYAEIRNTIASALYLIARNRWRPSYPSVAALLASCSKTQDPLGTQESVFDDRFQEVTQQLAEWKDQRFSPPRVSQSQFDKVGLTMLLWLWVSFHGSEACLAFPSAMKMLPEILNMSELNDNPELQKYSSAVLQVISGIYLPATFAEAVLERLVEAIQFSKSWRIRLHTLPALVMFFYRNLLMISPTGVSKVMDVLLECLGDENVEVREMSSKTLSGIVRCSQRQNIIPLKNQFLSLARTVKLPPRSSTNYGESMRKLHSAILGLCALIESFPYSVESWMPPLTEVLARHATDPPPISTTIRHCASEFKKVRKFLDRRLTPERHASYVDTPGMTFPLI
ncbi:armadillo-type protein [Boletus reticuloceps]|uniref:Armadillo-type protein n=1 Tax=Boletus reticuloceps TaxID=495285 RepID=A0A8I2Z253_9AGAM|nr:armadillo-type protein [Boletus reticuloceps]